jgi:methylated-DNA-[protein]-cysteine S-methyltransferase
MQRNDVLDQDATSVVDTPIGRLAVTASPLGVRRVSRPRVPARQRGAGSAEAAALLDRAVRELGEYFAGDRTEFELPIDLSRVQPPYRAVLEHIRRELGYGQTTSYGAVARELQLPGAGALAVGTAMARNPVLIMVPCHRVLGAGGALTGYSGGGVAVKRWLLDLENRRNLLPLDLPIAELAG